MGANYADAATTAANAATIIGVHDSDDGTNARWITISPTKCGR